MAKKTTSNLILILRSMTCIKPKSSVRVFSTYFPRYFLCEIFGKKAIKTLRFYLEELTKFINVKSILHSHSKNDCIFTVNAIWNTSRTFYRLFRAGIATILFLLSSLAPLLHNLPERHLSIIYLPFTKYNPNAKYHPVLIFTTSCWNFAFALSTI